MSTSAIRRKIKSSRSRSNYGCLSILGNKLNKKDNKAYYEQLNNPVKSVVKPLGKAAMTMLSMIGLGGGQISDELLRKENAR